MIFYHRVGQLPSAQRTFTGLYLCALTGAGVSLLPY